MTRFSLVAPLGQGGSGSVWRARRQTPAGQTRDVAVKLLSSADEKQAERFRDEVRTVAQMHHPNIIRLVDIGVLDQEVVTAPRRFAAGTPFLVMDLMPGRLRRDSPLEPGGFRQLLLQLLNALGHAHARGIIHRDLKPANVLGASAEGPPWILTDFGIASVIRGRVRSGGSFGTPAFMAPEQIRGLPHQQGTWTDLHELG